MRRAEGCGVGHGIVHACGSGLTSPALSRHTPLAVLVLGHLPQALRQDSELPLTSLPSPPVFVAALPPPRTAQPRPPLANHECTPPPAPPHPTSPAPLGNRNRAVRHTEMNQASSRSHAILQLVVEQWPNGGADGTVIRSKLNFVDLAGEGG